MTDDTFTWPSAKKDGEIVIPEQAAIAVYRNADGDLIIRQEAPYGEDDHYIIVQLTYLPRLITALEQARIKYQNEE